MLAYVFLSVFLFILTEDVKGEFEEVWQIILSFWWSLSFGELVFRLVRDRSNQQAVEHANITSVIIASDVVAKELSQFPIVDQVLVPLSNVLYDDLSRNLVRAECAVHVLLPVC